MLVLDRFNHGYSEDLGVAFGAGNASVMAYHLRLNCPVAMTDGWIGVAPLYHDECTFHWSASKDGDGTSVQMVNGEAMTLDTDLALCLYPGPPPEGECVASVEGEGEGVPAVHHGADENEDGQISLSELLRVIQFFNSGGYSCDLPVSDPPTEDGYRPGSGDTSCSAHSSDYNPQDWAISLSELLRVIQFFNSGGYFHCPNADPPTEDGFCPGEAF